ncbi:hypothetical protein O6H91_12G020800 [Diphasiastrum complanatum]|uniref:Uncharacterized protein n=1 Tax=Diphasiastrum complanatum TaxID=34168 RepID=A0ACC2BZF6_DIPCM|nr:hypothetical protein O6H91_12G020800 [Diphasiastrum complanatum]
MATGWKTSAALTPFTPGLLFSYIILGAFVAVDNLLYTWRISYLPVSTSSLLSSSQVAFNSVFALLLVRRNYSSFCFEWAFAPDDKVHIPETSGREILPLNRRNTDLYACPSLPPFCLL